MYVSSTGENYLVIGLLDGLLHVLDLGLLLDVLDLALLLHVLDLGLLLHVLNLGLGLGLLLGKQSVKGFVMCLRG